MMGQNSFSNTHTNSNDAVFSNGEQPAPNPAPSQPFSPGATMTSSSSDQSSTGGKSNLKTVILVVIALLIGAGIATAIILLVNKNSGDKADNGKEEIISDLLPASPENDGTKAIEETVNEFDKRIEAAKTDEETFALKIDKVSYYNINEDYDAAISALNTFDVNSLSYFEQYHVYNAYVTAYKGKGDTAQAERYEKLAKEAQDKEYSSAE